MSDGTPGNDDRQLFGRDEVVAAYSLIVPREKAEAWADELLKPVPDGHAAHHTHLGDDVLGLLSLVSDDCAERVRRAYGISKMDAAIRREEVRHKFRLK